MKKWYVINFVVWAVISIVTLIFINIGQTVSGKYYRYMDETGSILIALLLLSGILMILCEIYIKPKPNNVEKGIVIEHDNSDENSTPTIVGDDNNYHKNSTTTCFQIADANWGMYHTKNFETEEEARKVIETEYKNRSKNDGSDDYWRNRKQVVLKVTRTIEFLG